MSKLSFILFFILSNILSSQIEMSSTPKVSEKSFLFPLSINIELADELVIKNTYYFFHTNFAFDKHVWYKYSRNSYSMTTDQSYFDFTKNNVNILFGRRNIAFGTGTLSGLFISPLAPSLDNFSFTIQGYKRFDFTSIVVRLDNRETTWNGVSEVANRWLLMRKVGINYKNFNAGIIDAVVSTGFNRSVDWYYLTPLSYFHMETKHQYIWRAGGDSTTVTGLGDNDNHFVGGYWKVSYKDMSFYGEWLIDEWQLTPEYRPHVQTVFGIMLGFEFLFNNNQMVFEYSIASPWLYLSRGLFNTPEYHGIPLGLNRPNMHSLGVVYKYIFSEQQYLTINVIFKQFGSQSFDTQYDPWDNKIKLYSFNKSSPPELSIKYGNNKGKYIQFVELKRNWLVYDGTHLILGWDFQHIFN